MTQTKEFMASLQKAHAPAEELNTDEKEVDTDKMMEMLEKSDAYEVERSVFPSLSTFIERMDENLLKSY